jgi:hypothetical protein
MGEDISRSRRRVIRGPHTVSDSDLSYAEWVAMGGPELVEDFERLLDQAYGRKLTEGDEPGGYRLGG